MGRTMPFTMIQHCHFSLFNSYTTSTTTALMLPRRLGRVWSRLLSYPRHLPGNIMERLEKRNGIDITKLVDVKRKLELVGINCDDSCIPGRYIHLLCPKCQGGQSMERSLSLHIVQDGDFAMWRCFRVDCGWAGRVFAGSNSVRKVISSRKIMEQSLGLEPLGEQLIAYFGERMISEETLRRNSVMQIYVDQAVIAFTYRHNGVLVGCKYRTIDKKFRQEKGTVKWLYGLDDINEASEVIIVEGEIDKLSVEEAGFQNCVSVPCGAPQKVSDKELPPREKDTGFQYFWNCKEYLDKVSRIILATDGDTPGRALAEELARRLGKDRCWRVRWPKKDEFCSFKDANEVLKHLGPGALKEVIENAELYQLHVSLHGSH
ncbi:Twinkle-like protein, chloroplastic/mitochondrial [Melia azedarach]|uniref:Twinkle-like protein, chloroplastic/mitochondrial n=1 Tax=Melia azedarach TaxID=155640 RepID=A0ACC1WV38_MELAZ|nr:Twinkle-like protein, chloroplastic/mitochondrial [Melia azedarach]